MSPLLPQAVVRCALKVFKHKIIIIILISCCFEVLKQRVFLLEGGRGAGGLGRPLDDLKQLIVLI